MKIKCSVLPALLFSQHCVMVQVQQKENILLRAPEKKETLVKKRIEAGLASILRGEKVSLVFRVEEQTTTTERHFYREKVFVENRLTREGGRMRYYVSWISFAFEEEGVGSYLLYLLGGIPMTLGINIPVALYDWISMPFRLRDENIERSVHEDKIIAKANHAVADCSRFAVRIYAEEYPLSPRCQVELAAPAFEAMAARHSHLPHFEGVFRYELLDRERHEVKMNSQVFVKKLSGTAFLERP